MFVFFRLKVPVAKFLQNATIPSMSDHLRHADILALARTAGKVTVDGLAARFGVTVQTIRRDLTALDSLGQLSRVHGGAVLPTGTANIAHAERRQLGAAAKARMADAAAQEVKPGMTVFVGIGTSTEALAKALLHHSDLQVLTNNFHVAEILAANSGANLILTGGTYRRSDGGLVGPAAIATIRQFRCDLAVFGCSALDERGDMLDFDMAEVEVNRAILDHARRRILLADHSKLDRRAPVRVGSLSDVDLLITDKPLPAPLAEACAGWGTEVRIA
jgi:DeoR family glycerol-3-phosphate regulon repressor